MQMTKVILKLIYGMISYNLMHKNFSKCLSLC